MGGGGGDLWADCNVGNKPQIVLSRLVAQPVIYLFCLGSPRIVVLVGVQGVQQAGSFVGRGLQL
jgi:hypothetical protein